MCICSNFSRRGLPRKFSLILTFFVCCNFYSLEAASKPALKPAARLILKDCLFCSKFAWSRTGVATEDANAFSRLAESALFCANFAVAPAGLICLACAILLAVTVWKLTAFSADFGGRCGIYGVCDTEPTEGERLVRQLWHYTPFTVKKPAKQVQRVACSGSFSKLY